MVTICDKCCNQANGMTSMKNNNRSRTVPVLEFQDRANNCGSSTSLFEGATAFTENIMKKLFPDKRSVSAARFEDKLGQLASLRSNTDAQSSKSSSSHTVTSTCNLSTSNAMVDTPMFSSSSLLQNIRKWEAVEIRYVERDNCAPQDGDRNEIGCNNVKDKASQRPSPVDNFACGGDQLRDLSKENPEDKEVKKQTVVVEKLHVRNLLNMIRQQCGDLSTSRLSEYRPAPSNGISTSPKRTRPQCTNSLVEKVTDSSPAYSSYPCTTTYEGSARKDIHSVKDEGLNKYYVRVKDCINPMCVDSCKSYEDGDFVYRRNPDIEGPIPESTSHTSPFSGQTKDQATQLDSDPCDCCTSQETVSSDLISTIVIYPKKQPATSVIDQSSGARRRIYPVELKTRISANEPVAKKKESICLETQLSESVNSKPAPSVLSQEEIDCYKQTALRILMDRKKLEQNRLKHQRQIAVKNNKAKHAIMSNAQSLPTTTKTIRPTMNSRRNCSVSSNSLCHVKSRIKNTKPTEVVLGENATESSILSAARIQGQIERHKRRMSQSPKAKAARPRELTNKKQHCLPSNRSKFSQRYRNCKAASRRSQDSLAAAEKNKSVTGKPTKQERNILATPDRQTRQQISPLSWSLLYALMNKGDKIDNNRESHFSHIRPERNAPSAKKHRFDKSVMMYDEFHQIMLQAAKKIERSKTSLTPLMRERNPALNTKKMSNLTVRASHACPWSVSNKQTKTLNCTKLKPGNNSSVNVKKLTETPKVTSSFLPISSKKKCASSQTSLTDREKQLGFQRSSSNVGRQDINTFTKDIGQQTQAQQQQQQQNSHVEKQQQLSQREQNVNSGLNSSFLLPPKPEHQRPTDSSPKEPNVDNITGATINQGFAEMLKGILKSPTARATQALGLFQTNQAIAGDETNKTSQMTVEQILQCYQELFSNKGTTTTNQGSQSSIIQKLQSHTVKENNSSVRPSLSPNRFTVQRSPAKASSCSQKLLYSPAVSSIHKPCHVNEKRHQTRSASVTLGSTKELPGFRRQTQSSLNKINIPSSKPTSPAPSRVRSRNCSTERQTIGDNIKATNIQLCPEIIDKSVQGSAGVRHSCGDSRSASENPNTSATVCSSHILQKLKPMMTTTLPSKHPNEGFVAESKKIDGNADPGIKESSSGAINGSLEVAMPSPTPIKLEQNLSALKQSQENRLLQNTDIAQGYKETVSDVTGLFLNCAKIDNPVRRRNFIESGHPRAGITMEKTADEIAEYSKDNNRKAALSMSQPIIGVDAFNHNDVKLTKNLRVLSETALQQCFTKKPPIPFPRKNSFSGCAEYLIGFEKLPQENDHPKDRKSEDESLVTKNDSDSTATPVFKQTRDEKKQFPPKLGNVNSLRISQNYELATEATEKEPQKATTCNQSFYAEISNESREMPAPTLLKCDPTVKTGKVKVTESLSDSGLWTRRSHLRNTWQPTFKDVKDPHFHLLIGKKTKQEKQDLSVGNVSPLRKHLLANKNSAKIYPIQNKRVMETREEQPDLVEKFCNKYLNVEDNNMAQVTTIRSCGAITKLASFSDSTSYEEDNSSSTFTQKPPKGYKAKNLPPPLPKPRCKRLKNQAGILESDSTDESSLDRLTAKKTLQTPGISLSRDPGRAASQGNASPSTCEENVVQQLQEITVAKTCEMVLNQSQVSETVTTTETTDGKLHSCMFGDYSEGSSNSSFQNDIVMAKASPSSSQHSSWVISSSWENESRRRESHSKTSSTSETTPLGATANGERQSYIDLGELPLPKHSQKKPKKGSDVWSHMLNFYQRPLNPVSERTEKTHLTSFVKSNLSDVSSSSQESQVAFNETKLYPSATPLVGEILSDSDIVCASNKLFERFDRQDKPTSPTSQSCNKVFTGKDLADRKTAFFRYNGTKELEPEASFLLEDSSSKNTFVDAGECLKNKGPLLLRSNLWKLQNVEPPEEDEDSVCLKARPLASLEELRLSRVGRSIFAERRRIYQTRPQEQAQGLFYSNSPVHVLDDSQETCYVKPQRVATSAPDTHIDKNSPFAEVRNAATTFTLPPVLPAGPRSEKEVCSDTNALQESSRSYNDQFQTIGEQSQRGVTLTARRCIESSFANMSEVHTCRANLGTQSGSSSSSLNNGNEYADTAENEHKETFDSVGEDTQSLPLAVTGSDVSSQSSTSNERYLNTHKEDSSSRCMPQRINQFKQPKKAKVLKLPIATLIQRVPGSSAPYQLPMKDEIQHKLFTQHVAETHTQISRLQTESPPVSANDHRATVSPTAAVQTSTTDLLVVSLNSLQNDSPRRKTPDERAECLQNQGIYQQQTTKDENVTDSPPPNSSPKRILSRRKPDSSPYIEKKKWENLELFMESVKKEFVPTRPRIAQNTVKTGSYSLSAPTFTVTFASTHQDNFPIHESDPSLHVRHAGVETADCKTFKDILTQRASTQSKIKSFSYERSASFSRNKAVSYAVSSTSQSLSEAPQAVYRGVPFNYFSPISPPKRMDSSWTQLSPQKPCGFSVSGDTYFQPLNQVTKSMPSREETLCICPKPEYISNLSPTLSHQPIAFGNPFTTACFRLTSPKQKCSYDSPFSNESKKSHLSCPPKMPNMSPFSCSPCNLRAMRSDADRVCHTESSQPILFRREYPEDFSGCQQPSLQLTEEDINYLIKISDKKEGNDENEDGAILSLGARKVITNSTPKESENLMLFSDSEMVSSDSFIGGVSGLSDSKQESTNENDNLNLPVITQLAPFNSLSADSLMLLIQPAIFKHPKEVGTLNYSFGEKTSALNPKMSTHCGRKSDSRTEGSTLSLDSSNCISYTKYTNPDHCLFCSKYCTEQSHEEIYSHSKENSVVKPECRKNTTTRIPGQTNTPQSADLIIQKLFQSLFQSPLAYNKHKEYMRATNVWDTINLLTSKMFDLIINERGSSCRAAKSKKRRIVLKRKGCVKIENNLSQRKCGNKKPSNSRNAVASRNSHRSTHHRSGGSKNSIKSLTSCPQTVEKSLEKQRGPIHHSFSVINHGTKCPVNNSPFFKNINTQKTELDQSPKSTRVKGLRKHESQINEKPGYNTSKNSERGQNISKSRLHGTKKVTKAKVSSEMRHSETIPRQQALNKPIRQDVEKATGVKVEEETHLTMCSPSKKISLDKLLPFEKENFLQIFSFSRDSEANTSINANHYKESRHGGIFNTSLSSTDTSSNGFDSPPSVVITRHKGAATRTQSPITSCFSSRLSEASEQDKDFSNSSFSFTEISNSSCSLPLRNFYSVVNKEADCVCVSEEKKDVAAEEEKMVDGGNVHDEITTIEIPSEPNDSKWMVPTNEAILDIYSFPVSTTTTLKAKFVMEFVLPQVIPQITLEPTWLKPIIDIQFRGDNRENLCSETESNNQLEMEIDRRQTLHNLDGHSQPLKENGGKQESINLGDKDLEEIPCVKTKGYRALEMLQEKNDENSSGIAGLNDKDNIDHIFCQTEQDIDILGLSILLLASADDSKVLHGDVFPGNNTKASRVSYNIVEDFYDESPPVLIPESMSPTDELNIEEKVGEKPMHFPFMNRFCSPLPNADFLYPNNVVMYDENCALETGQFIHPNRNILFCSGKDLDLTTSKQKTESPTVENNHELIKELCEAARNRKNNKVQKSPQKYRKPSNRTHFSSWPYGKLKSSYRSSASNPNSSKKIHGMKKSAHYRTVYRRDKPRLSTIFGSCNQSASASERTLNSFIKAHKSTSYESFSPFDRSQRRTHYSRLAQGAPMRTSTLLTESPEGCLWRMQSSPSTKPRRRVTPLSSTDEYGVDTYRDLGSFITEMEDSSTTGSWNARLAREALRHERRARDYSVTFTNSSTDLISDSKLGLYYRRTSSLSSSSIQPMIQVNTYVDNGTQVCSSLPEDPAPVRCQGEQTNLKEHTSDKSIQAEPDASINRYLNSDLRLTEKQLSEVCTSPQAVTADKAERAVQSNALNPSSDTFAYNILQDFMKLSLTSLVESLVDTKLKRERNGGAYHDEDANPNLCSEKREDNAGLKSLTNLKEFSQTSLTKKPNAFAEKMFSNRSKAGENNIHRTPLSVDFSRNLSKYCPELVNEETFSPLVKKDDTTVLDKSQKDDAIFATAGPENPEDIKEYVSPGLNKPISRKFITKTFRKSEFFHSVNAPQPNENQIHRFSPTEKAYPTKVPKVVDSNCHDTLKCTDQVQFLTTKPSSQPIAVNSKSNTAVIPVQDAFSTHQHLDLSSTPLKKSRKLSLSYVDSPKSENFKHISDNDTKTILPKTGTSELDGVASRHSVYETEEKTPPAKESLCEVTTLSSSSSSLVDYGGLKYVLSRESKALWKRLTILESTYENCEVCKRQYKSTTGRSLSPQYIRPVRTCQSRPCRLHKPSKSNVRTESAQNSKSSTEHEKEILHPITSMQGHTIHNGTTSATTQNAETAKFEVNAEIKQPNVDADVLNNIIPSTFKPLDATDKTLTKPSTSEEAEPEVLEGPETAPRMFLKRKQNLPIAEDGIPPSKKASQSSCRSSSHRDTVEYPYPRGKVTGGAYRRLGFLRGGKTARMIQLFERSSSSSGRVSSYGLHSARLGSPPSGSSGWSNNASCGKIYSNCSLHRWDMQEETKLDSELSSSTTSKAKVNNHSIPYSIIDDTNYVVLSKRAFRARSEHDILPNDEANLASNHGNFSLCLNTDPAQGKALSFSTQVRFESDDVFSRSRFHRENSSTTKYHLSPTARPNVAAVAEFPLRFESFAKNDKRNATNQRTDCAERLPEIFDQEEIIIEGYKSQHRQSSPDADQCIKTLDNILCEMRNTFPNDIAHQSDASTLKAVENALHPDGPPKNPIRRNYSLSPKVLRTQNESNSASLQLTAFNDTGANGRKNPPQRKFSPSFTTSMRAKELPSALTSELEVETMIPQVTVVSHGSTNKESEETVSYHSISVLLTSASEKTKEKEGLQIEGKDLTGNSSQQINESLPHTLSLLNHLHQKPETLNKCCRQDKVWRRTNSFTVPERSPNNVHTFSSTLQLKSSTNTYNAITETNTQNHLPDSYRVCPAQIVEGDFCEKRNTVRGFKEENKPNDLVFQHICHTNPKNILSSLPTKLEIEPGNNASYRSTNVLKESHICEDATVQSFPNYLGTTENVETTKYARQNVDRPAPGKISKGLDHKSGESGSAYDPQNIKFGDISSHEATCIVKKPHQPSLEESLPALHTSANLPQNHTALSESRKSKGHKWSRLNRSIASMLRTSKHCSSPAATLDSEDHEKTYIEPSHTSVTREQPKRACDNKKPLPSAGKFENRSMVLESKETEKLKSYGDASHRLPTTPILATPNEQDKAKRKFDIKSILSFGKRNSSRDKRKL